MFAVSSEQQLIYINYRQSRLTFDGFQGNAAGRHFRVKLTECLAVTRLLDNADMLACELAGVT